MVGFWDGVRWHDDTSFSLPCFHFFPSHLLFSANSPPPSASHPPPNHYGLHVRLFSSITSPLPSCFPYRFLLISILPPHLSSLFSPLSTLTLLTPSSAPPQFHLHPFFLGAAGGLLSERYLRKVEPISRVELYTASLSKYKNMINTWGGWSLFQDLLGTLETVAKRRNSSIASVAMRYVLDRPAVGGVIVGCRLGVAGAGQHISDSLRSCSSDLQLMAEDLSAIEAVTQRSRDLMAIIGDCGDEYRN